MFCIAQALSEINKRLDQIFSIESRPSVSSHNARLVGASLLRFHNSCIVRSQIGLGFTSPTPQNAA